MTTRPRKPTRPKPCKANVPVAIFILNDLLEDTALIRLRLRQALAALNTAQRNEK
jgi:hypothetical protein